MLMKKMLMPVIAATIIAVFYIVSSGNGPMQGKSVVDADTRSGGDDDAGRAEYELAMLRDPVTGRIPDHIRQRELDFAASLPQAEWGGTSALEKTTSTTWSHTDCRLLLRRYVALYGPGHKLGADHTNYAVQKCNQCCAGHPARA